VAGLVLNQTGSLAATTSQAVQSISTSTMSAAQAAWTGVDLVNITGMHKTGSILVDDALVLDRWLASPDGTEIIGCNATEHKIFWNRIARQITVEQPFLAAQHRDLSLNGLYSESKAQASLAWSGQLLFHFSCLEVTFVPVWANPFWSFLELDMDTERPQIVQQVQEFGASLPTYNVSWQLHPDLL